MKPPSSPLLLAALGAAALALVSGCGTPPPKSPLPTGQAAIERMRASSSCGYGVQADAKIDFFGKQGRIRGNLLLYAFASAKMRMDAMTAAPRVLLVTPPFTQLSTPYPATPDLDGVFAKIQSGDVEIVQEPAMQPYGVRDCAVRDPAGNLIRIQER